MKHCKMQQNGAHQNATRWLLSAVRICLKLASTFLPRSVIYVTHIYNRAQPPVNGAYAWIPTITFGGSSNPNAWTSRPIAIQ